ncbi:MAG: sigma-54-dependent Fis family transcriptional regulator [bacterium]|nr:sigma-54-dependent Fis family transcriptional regulator [bacterium]MCP5067355.1 sigma-54-dependent Fis family transcriptional regulator [bacterium]
MRVLARLRDEGLRRDVLSVVRAAGYAAEEGADDSVLLERAADGDIDASLVEVSCHADLHLVEELGRVAPDVGVVAVGGQPGVDLVVDAFRVGAADYLRMPFDVSSLERALAQVLRRENDGPVDSTFLTQDPRMRTVLDQLRRVAKSEATVRLVGESGTGKELLARWLHDASTRRRGPFVVLSCAGLTPALAESELFGHAQGAFSGATESRSGQLAAANGGTLVLDEVADLRLDLQPKLLRALQEREVIPLGGRTSHALDVRVVATTQCDLDREVAARRFRADLYYRLDVVSLRIPPLRERPGDIALLADSFLDRFAKSSGTEKAELGDSALASLSTRPFRGNVRELENLMRRAALLYPGRSIDLDRLVSSGGASGDSLSSRLRSLNLRELERAAVIRSLEITDGNRTMASQALGISVRTLRNKIRLYELA